MTAQCFHFGHDHRMQETGDPREMRFAPYPAVIHGYSVLTRDRNSRMTALCELLLSLLPENTTGLWRLCWVGYGYYKMHDSNKTWDKRNDSIIWATQRTPGIIVAPDRSAEFEEWWRCRRQYGLVLPVRRRDDDSTVPRARTLKHNSVDFDAAKSWIKACQKLRGNTCGGLHQKFVSLRVIDCRARTVITAPINCEYVAMSYVWGPAHLASTKDLSDWDQAPELIRDAVTATISLGYDYLWVDYYSIPQDDPVERDRQIQNMDKIYFGAQVTIIATCSENSSIGLSGIGGRERQCSVTAAVGQNTLVTIYSKEVRSIINSKWNTRGWIYLEGVLSRRRSVFTDTGLFYQCVGRDPGQTCATESLDVRFGTEGLRSLMNDQHFFPDLSSVTKHQDTIWD